MKKLVPLALALIAVFPILLLSGCGGDDEKVTKLSLSSTKEELFTTDTLTLKVSINPEDVSKVSLTWDVSDKAILTVSGDEFSDGNIASAVITPVSPGQSDVTVTSANGTFAKCSITVNEAIEVESITLSASDLILPIDGKNQLTAKILPENCTDSRLSWSTSDSQIVDIKESSGRFIGVGEGTATITATAPNGIKAQCKVTVQKITPDFLDELIAAQPFRVTSTRYSVQSDRYKTLYPDMLQVILQNDTESNIQNAYISFVAWDKNGLPVKIKKAHIDLDGGTYIASASYDNINMIPGSSFGENYGFEIDEESGISDFKAIVTSYESFDGTTWQNPYYSDWCKLYENKQKP